MILNFYTWCENFVFLLLNVLKFPHLMLHVHNKTWLIYLFWLIIAWELVKVYLLLISNAAFCSLKCSDRLDPNYFCVHVFWATFFSFFFFFFFGSAAIIDFVNCEQYIHALFTVPQITLFSKFFIKNGSHSTIYIFKNYFATVFSVSVFSFSKNKLNPNTPVVTNSFFFFNLF